jgi:hypothetical protein
MPKTYNTISTFTSGQILTAAQMNAIGTNVNNYRVPPSCEVRLSGNVNPYTTGAAISWAAQEHDTDDMWAIGDPTKVFTPTVGIYSVYFSGRTIQASGTSLTIGAPVIKLNGTSITQAYFRALTTGACIYAVSAIVVTTAATDYFTFAVEHEGGTTYEINGGSSRSALNNRAVVAWIGQVS